MSMNASKVQNQKMVQDEDGNPTPLFQAVLATMETIGVSELTEDNLYEAAFRVDLLDQFNVYLITPKRGRPSKDSLIRKGGEARNVDEKELRQFVGLVADVPEMDRARFLTGLVMVLEEEFSMRWKVEGKKRGRKPRADAAAPEAPAEPMAEAVTVTPPEVVEVPAPEVQPSA